MGVKNRQRRAAKQKQRGRTRQPRVPRAEGYTPSLADAVWAAVFALRDGYATDELFEVLDAKPGMDAVLADAVAQQRALVQRHGWSDDDLAEVETRRLRVPAGATATERGMRWLALMAQLPPLPKVEPRPPTASVDDGMLAKIRALLAKAESTTFPEEAEALSAKAQELMARHRIDRVLLDDGGGHDQPMGRRIWLDDPYAGAKASLLAAVARANRCQSVELTGLGCAHLVGFPTDLEVVELLHTSLLVQATAAIAAAGPQRDGRGRSRTRSFRQSFLIAYAARIGERLVTTSAAVEDEVVHGGVDLLPVLARRDREVTDVLTRAFPRLTTKRVAITNAAGWRAGTIAADGADLSVGPRLEP